MYCTYLAHYELESVHAVIVITTTIMKDAVMVDFDATVVIMITIVATIRHRTLSIAAQLILQQLAYNQHCRL